MNPEYLKIINNQLFFTESFFQNCMVQTQQDNSIKVSKATLLSDSDAEKISKFKYTNTQGIILEGLWRYQLEYEQQKQNKHIQVIVKVKPNDEKIFAIVQRIVDGCNVSLTQPLETYLNHTEFVNGTFKETILLTEYGTQLKRYVPKQLGIYLDAEKKEFIRIEEILSDQAMAGTADDISSWDSERINAVINDLSEIHAVWYGKTADVNYSDIFLNMHSQRMGMLAELWQKMAEFIYAHYQNLITSEMQLVHQRCLDNISVWTMKADLMKKTIIYNDCNPKNIAFLKQDNKLTACFYDWERALISLPQQDVAELLCYILPENFTREQLQQHIEQQRLALQQLSGNTIEEENWQEGFLYALYYLLSNRLSFHLLIQHVFADRPYVLRAFRVLHRMLKCLQ